MEYNGWSLFNKIILICRPPDKNGIYQAYLCDPKNKKQIENARGWGRTTIYGEYDKETHSYPNKKTFDAEEFEFDNEDFELYLYDSAHGSSQGGKLSFWNCLVKKDDKTFRIGINSDLLLNLLLASNFTKGKCEDKVLFARCRGEVGVLHEGMEEYKRALNDMESKQKIKKKTSKHIVGHNYVTLTEDDIYLGDFYQWYEPIYEKTSNRSWPYGTKDILVALKKLEKPIVYKLFDRTHEFSSMKEYCDYFKKEKNLYSWRFKEKLPSRTEGDVVIKLDATNEDWEDVLKETRNKEIKNAKVYYKPDLFLFTLSTSPKVAFNFTDDEKKFFAQQNIRVEE